MAKVGLLHIKEGDEQLLSELNFSSENPKQPGVLFVCYDYVSFWNCKVNFVYGRKCK